MWRIDIFRTVDPWYVRDFIHTGRHCQESVMWLLKNIGLMNSLRQFCSQFHLSISFFYQFNSTCNNRSVTFLQTRNSILFKSNLLSLYSLLFVILFLAVPIKSLLNSIFIFKDFVNCFGCGVENINLSSCLRNREVFFINESY